MALQLLPCTELGVSDAAGVVLGVVEIGAGVVCAMGVLLTPANDFPSLSHARP